MLKIWGRKNSTNVKKVLWCAEELGLSYESIDAGGAFGIVDEPHFRAMNPNGLVPVIEDDGFVLWESNTIVRYLAASHGGEALYPGDLRARAQAEKWMDWTSGTFFPSFRTLFWGLIRTAPEKRDMAAIAAAFVRCGELLAIVDQALAKQPYLSGGQCGVADIALGVYVYPWFEMPLDNIGGRPELPHLAAWYERLKERPAYRKAVLIPLS
jgi:glutathione S-transferase